MRLLRALAERDELSRDELRREFDASRTTIQRNLDALVERGWVENSNRTYSIAPCGELAAEEFSACYRKMRAVNRLQPFLRWTSTEDLDLAHLSGAAVVVATESDPYAPVNTRTWRRYRRLRASEPSSPRSAATPRR